MPETPFFIKGHLSGSIDLKNYDSSYSTAHFYIGDTSVENFSILLPEGTDKNSNIAYAATELQKYIKSATGADLPILYGENGTEGYAIRFHSLSFDSELGKELGYEGYRYTVTDGDLNIYGTLRGNMYCVYDILEDCLGYNFYSNTTTFLRKTHRVDIPEGTDITKVPDLRFRYVGQTFGRNGAEIHYYPKHLNGTQLYVNEENYKLGLLTGPLFINAHSYGYYWKMATGYQSQQFAGRSAAYLIGDLKTRAYDRGIDMEVNRNDWTSLSPWQPCTSSEEDYNTEFEGLVQTMTMIQTWGHAYLETNSIMSFSPCDNIGGLCRCRICSKKANGGSVTVTPTQLEYVTKNYTGEYTVSGRKITFQKETYSGVYVDFTNRAAYDITHAEKKYYTGRHTSSDGEDYYVDLGSLKTTYENMELMVMTYDLSAPTTVKPFENIILLFCGQGCNQHFLGSEECGDNTTVVNNRHYTMAYTNAGENGVNRAIMEWSRLCHEAGAEIWFWSYSTTYRFPMAPTPCVTNVYEDFKWLINEAHVDGIFYEGGGGTNSFESLKAHIAASILWDSQMTEEEFREVVLEYLYIYYGKGYEKVYTYLQMHQECGDLSGHCYINNFSYPSAMYSFDYLREHYLEMRKLLTDAARMTSDETQKLHLRTLTATLDTVGLQAVHSDWYIAGNDKELYEQMYDSYYEEVNRLGLSFRTDGNLTFENYTDDIFTQVKYK